MKMGPRINTTRICGAAFLVTRFTSIAKIQYGRVTSATLVLTAQKAGYVCHFNNL